MAIPLFLLGVFALGLVRGTAVCLLICAPTVIPYVMVRKLSFSVCSKICLALSLPRIIVLTVLGMVIGYLVGALGKNLNFIPFAALVGSIGYILIGVIFVIIGCYVLFKSHNSRSPAAIHIPKLCSGLAAKILPSLQRTVHNQFLVFFMLGMVLSIACVGELLVLEGTALTGLAAGTLGIAAPALIGGITMFIFALGATLPVIFVTLVCSEVMKRVGTNEILEHIKIIGAMVLILLGIMLIYSTLT